VLHNKEGLKAEVIVNDRSEINVDVWLVNEQNVLSRTETEEYGI
jgi:G3E family GTPase